MPETSSKLSVDQGEKQPRAGLYARVSLYGKQTLAMQLDAMRDYARQRGWKIVVEVEDVEVGVENVGSGAAILQRREELLAAARRRAIDLVVVSRLDRWGRSLADLVNTLQELVSLKVGFVSLSEALDLNMVTGPALAGILAALAGFERERVKDGIAQAEKKLRTTK